MLFLEKLSQHTGDFSLIEKQDFIKMYKKQKDVQWITENKWFIQQSFDKKSVLLQNMERLRLNFSKIDSKTLVGVYYTMMKQHAQQGSALQHLSLPVRTYSLLISHVYRMEEDIVLLMRMSHLLLCGMVEQIVLSPLLFHRGHILIFYEKIFSVLLEITQPLGSPRFKCFIECLMNMQQYMRAQLTGYRVNIFKKIYNGLIVSVFKHLCIHNHLEDMDTVFVYNRMTTRGMVQKIVIEASPDDALALWKRCAHIQAYCKDNALKWSELKTNTTLWNLCKDCIDHELLSLQGVCSEDRLRTLMTYTNKNTKQTLCVLQKYPRVTQRQIIHSMLQYTFSKQHSKDTATDALYLFVNLFLKENMKYVLVVNNYDKAIMEFYVQEGYSSSVLLNHLLQITTLPEKSLIIWSQLYGEIPLTFIAQLLKKVTTCATIHVKRNNTIKLRSMFKSMDNTLRKLFQCGYCKWLHAEHILGVYLNFMKCFHESLHQCTIDNVLRLGRCLTMACFMQQLPTIAQTSSETHTCAICYNDDEAPLHALPCGHVFHGDCMIKMIQHASLNNHPHVLSACPYCKTPLKPVPNVHHQTVHETCSELASFGFATVE